VFIADEMGRLRALGKRELSLRDFQREAALFLSANR
jgi:hypothetical protein